jgi:hypothetical protein
MRIIIISDITEGSGSAIAFGLNIGKYLEVEVDILHLADPGTGQGTYADSQNTTPDEKLTSEEIHQREKNIAYDKIDSLVSNEADHPGYPHKINLVTDLEETGAAIKEIIRDHPETLLVTGTNPANRMAGKLNELLSHIRDLEILIMINPSGKEFKKPVNNILVTDFSLVGGSMVKRIFDLLKPFDPVVFACAIVNPDKSLGMEMKSQNWKQVVKPYAGESLVFRTGVLKGEDHLDTLMSYVTRNNPDLIILPKNNKSTLGNYLFSGDNTRNLIESLNKPLLLY